MIRLLVWCDTPYDSSSDTPYGISCGTRCLVRYACLHHVVRLTVYHVILLISCDMPAYPVRYAAPYETSWGTHYLAGYASLSRVYMTFRHLGMYSISNVTRSISCDSVRLTAVWCLAALRPWELWYGRALLTMRWLAPNARPPEALRQLPYR